MVPILYETQLAQSQAEAKLMLETLQEELARAGLAINTAKTKILTDLVEL